MCLNFCGDNHSRLFPLSLKRKHIIFKCPDSSIYIYRMKEHERGIFLAKQVTSVSNFNTEASSIDSVSYTATICNGRESLENP